MISSTSSSDVATIEAPRSRGPGMRCIARRALALWVLLMVGVALYGLRVDLARPVEFTQGGALAHMPFRERIPSLSNEWYLAADRDSLDYDVLYNGWWGTVGPMRAADVLFMGNSRAVYGYRPEAFQPHLDRVGLRGY